MPNKILLLLSLVSMLTACQPHKHQNTTTPDFYEPINEENSLPDGWNQVMFNPDTEYIVSLIVKTRNTAKSHFDAPNNIGR